MKNRNDEFIEIAAKANSYEEQAGPIEKDTEKTQGAGEKLKDEKLKDEELNDEKLNDEELGTVTGGMVGFTDYDDEGSVYPVCQSYDTGFCRLNCPWNWTDHSDSDIKCQKFQ